MDVLESYIDTSKLFILIFKTKLTPFKCWFIWIRSWVVAFESLKTKKKVQLGNPKSGRGRLRELFITKLKSQLKTGFYRGGRN